MKTCPICNATSFDDMEICFGCMHRFGEDPLLPFEIMDSDDIEPEEPRIDAGPVDGALPESETMFLHCEGSTSSTIVPVPGAGFNLMISVQPAGVQMPAIQREHEKHKGEQLTAAFAGSVR